MTIEPLRKDLTYEDFIRLASRKPDPNDRQWVYRYTVYMYDSDMLIPYPGYKIVETESKLFLSFEEAVANMRKDIDDFVMEYGDEGGYEFYCHRITQVPIGINEGYEGVSWIYDATGNLVDIHTPFRQSKWEDCLFFGRLPQNQRFHRGDIVEVIFRNKVVLAVMSEPSHTVDECWEKYRDYVSSGEADDYIQDHLHDTCIVIYGPGRCSYDHVLSSDIMEPHFFVSEEIKSEMRSWLDHQNDEDKPEEGNIDMITEDSRHSSFYGLSLSIDYDIDAKRPFLRIDNSFGLYSTICLDKPEYYTGKGKVELLDKEQLQALNCYLKERVCGKSRWWYRIRKWNYDYNQDKKYTIPQNTPMPDYRKLPYRK